MSIIKFKKRKGDAALFAIVALAVSGVIALGLAKVQHYGFHTLDTSEEFLKAEQFALEASEEIRNTSFDAVTALPKTQINSGSQNKSGKATPSGYYKEVQISRDGIFKDCKVNIYKGDNNNPVLSVNVTKVNPRSLVWGGFTNNTEDSEDGTATVPNETWSALTTQNFVNGKLINDYRMTDGKGTFTAKASIDYINDKLKNYIEDSKCLKRPAKSGVGTNRQPIFVNNDKLATVCAVNYTLNDNTAAPNIGILRKDSSGNITLDYWDHDSYLNGTNTPGTTTPDSGSSGGNAGTVIGSSAPKYFDFEFTDQDWIVTTIDFGTKTTYKVTGTKFAGDNEIEETYSFEFTASGKVKIYGNGGGNDPNIDGIENDYGHNAEHYRPGFIQFIDVSSKKTLYELNLNNHSHTRLVFEFNKI